MKRKHLFVVIFAIGSLFTACQEKEMPIPMSMELAGVQLEICGNQAGLVAANTTGLIIVRDSVANEATDTIYNVRTNLTLVLDSTFTADKMEEELLLNVIGSDGSTLVSLAPTDSMIDDSLMGFLKKDVGEKIEIGFAGSTEKNKFLMLENATRVTLTGFSFHLLDPEAMVDPQITQALDTYEKYGNNIAKEYDEFGWIGTAEASFLSDMTEDLDSRKESMSPKQLERYLKLRKRFLEYM